MLATGLAVPPGNGPLPEVVHLLGVAAVRRLLHPGREHCRQLQWMCGRKQASEGSPAGALEVLAETAEESPDQVDRQALAE